MGTPWKNKTGLAKAAVILATTLSIGAVSCGANGILVIHFMCSSDTGLQNRLVAAGAVELSVIAGSLIGLLVVFVMWIFSRSTEEPGAGNGDQI
jgi:hypothetical protein